RQRLGAVGLVAHLALSEQAVGSIRVRHDRPQLRWGGVEMRLSLDAHCHGRAPRLAAYAGRYYCALPTMLLGPTDSPAFTVVTPAGRSRFVLLADHAGQRVPARLGGLGLPQAELDRHIGWDIGIGGVA